MRLLNRIFETCIAALTLISPAFPAPIYSIRNLGNLGGTDITATGINQNGQVTGFGTNRQGEYHAFLWSSGVMSDLGISPSNFMSQAGGINNLGMIAGTQTGDSGTRAFAWSAGAYTSLGGLGTSASAINDAGQIAGLLTTQNSQGHAFRMSGGSLQDLGTMPGGTWSSAYGINNSGTVAGYGDTAGSNFRGFVTDSAGRMTPLGTLGGNSSYAMAINDAGQVGGSASARSGYVHAVTWNNGSIVDLGTLGGGNSFAYGINNASTVVGYSYLANSTDTHAFVYRDGILYDLNVLVPSLAGWTLLNAYGINDRGQVVGTGMLNGQLNAFLLDPGSQSRFNAQFLSPEVSPVPEPGTLVLAMLGLSLIAVWRRKIALVTLPPCQPE